MAGAGIRPNQQQYPSVGAPPTPSEVSSTARPHPPPPVLVDNHNLPPYDECRTIFILGLPDDVKERELPNLLRWLPGYEASQVNFKGDKPMGFALFSTPQSAMAAIDTLQNLVFDAESESVIHAEMAKKNLFPKRGRVEDSDSYDQSKRLRTGGDCSLHPSPPPVLGQQPPGYMVTAHPPYDPNTGHHAPSVPMHAPAPALYDPNADYHSPSVPMPAPAPASAPATIAAPSSYVSVKETVMNLVVQEALPLLEEPLIIPDPPIVQEVEEPVNHEEPPVHLEEPLFLPQVIQNPEAIHIGWRDIDATSDPTVRRGNPCQACGQKETPYYHNLDREE